MKRILFLSFAWLLVTGCNRDFEESDIGPSVPNDSSVCSSVRSQEEALEGLFAVLERIDAPDETRAGTFRQVQSVTALKTAAVCDPTRSGAGPGAEDLFYLVSFGEGNGSAVLGVDRRLPEVLAVLDETVLTPADFVRGDGTRSGEEGESPLDFILSRLVASSISTMAVNPGGPGTPGGPTNPNPNEPRQPFIPRTETFVTADKRQPPLLKTKWGQRFPYDKYCNGCLAGCVPIAVAQFLAYHNAPNPNTIMGETFDWNLIHQCDYGKTPSEAAEDEIARYVRMLGIVLKTEYGVTGSSTTMDNAAATVKCLGFPAAALRAYDSGIAQQIVLAQKPLIMRGRGASGGHAWIVDGWYYYESHTYRIVGAVSTHIGMTQYIWAHCNFGWYGCGDGYYDPWVFDTSLCKDKDKDAGDRNITDNLRFDAEFQLIAY